MTDITVDNPSKVAAENSSLPPWTINGGKELDREASNQRYAQRAIDIENAAKEAAKPRMVGDFAEFMQLFEPAEQVAIKTASLDPNNVQVGLWYDQAVAANSIDLESDRLLAGVQVMVEAGLLKAERRDAILAKGYGVES